MPRKAKEQVQEATETATPAQSEQPSRELGDDTATEKAVEQKKAANWEPRSTIAVPLTEEAKRDPAKGEVARYVDGYRDGVSLRIDSDDKNFRPSPEVLEPVKEKHEGRNTPKWRSRVKDWHKETRNNPVAERLDAEHRFEEMVERSKAEKGGKTPF